MQPEPKKKNPKPPVSMRSLFWDKIGYRKIHGLDSVWEKVSDDGYSVN